MNTRSTSTPSVIVAEDNDLVRTMVVEVLGDAGFRVIAAQNAEEALIALNSWADSIHLLFTDIHMPGAINGLALAHRARKNWPWVTVLITSGSAAPDTMLPPDSEFLGKPYAPHQVVTRIKQLLAA